MKTTTQQFGTSQKIIALAILAVFGPANAADDVAELIKPASSIGVGAGAVSGNSSDRAIFGQYNGLREHNGVLQLDIDYLKRDDATGTWTTLQGRNLGLDNRELGASMQKQGDWKVTGEYSELVRRELRTINTADLGVGTTTPTVVRLATPGTGSDVNLQLKRIGLGLGVEKWFGPSLQFEASFKNEDKDGARFWGKGYDCASYVCGTSTATAMNQALFVKNAILMTAEPVNSNTRQFEAKLNFNDEKLKLSAGYYGSFFKNSNGNLTPTVPNSLNNGIGQAFTLYPAVSSAIIAGGGTSLQNVLQLPTALPPDNQAHQFSLSGNYAFTPKTKATFKYAYTHATQNQDFSAMGLPGAPGGVTNLGGRVDSTLAQFGLTAKPMEKLSLLANVRYERKEDKTPNALYTVEGRAVVPATTPVSYTIADQANQTPGQWNNNHVSNTRLAGKLEASYMLPQNIRATVGMDYNKVERLVPESLTEEVLAGLGPLREKTQETGYRLELRRSMSETLTGAIGYTSSKRTGSDWTSVQTFNPAALNATIANPLTSAANRLTAQIQLGFVNTYCGGRTCYAQSLPATSILGMSAGTPFFAQMTDLNRDKWKLSANWAPMERLSIQFSIEDGKDKNANPVNPIVGGKGWRDTGVAFYNIDADFTLSDNWKLTGYYSHGDQTLKINHSQYLADLNNRNDALGLGLLGKPTSRLEIGANLTYLNDVNKYGLQASPTLSGATLAIPLGVYTAPSAANLAQAAIGLPDVTFRQTTLSLFGKYALEKNADLRVSLVVQRARFNEWTWGNNGVPFTYADNTTVSLKQEQNVTFVGAAYIYKWQ